MLKSSLSAKRARMHTMAVHDREIMAILHLRLSDMKLLNKMRHRKGRRKYTHSLRIRKANISINDPVTDTLIRCEEIRQVMVNITMPHIAYR